MYIYDIYISYYILHIYIHRKLKSVKHSDYHTRRAYLVTST